MLTYEQDYKTVIRCAFEDEDKAKEYFLNKDNPDNFYFHWGKPKDLGAVASDICRSFLFERTSFKKIEGNHTNTKFLEGYGECIEERKLKGFYGKYFLENVGGIVGKDSGKVWVWEEEELDEDFSITKVSK